MPMQRTPKAPRHLAGAVYEWDLPLAKIDAIHVPGAVRITSPSGDVLQLGAFQDSGGRRARLWAYAPGQWSYVIAETGETGAFTVPVAVGWPASPLRLSANRRYLTRRDGTPALFFADTCWFITWKGTPEQWERYLNVRAAQGFSVLQTHLLPLSWDLPDVEGNYPFIDMDPAQPNDAYFRRVEQFAQMAAARGLFVCPSILWGGPRPHLIAARFSTEQAVAFTKYAVARFAAFPTIWNISGDAPHVQELEKWEAVGAAVEESDPYRHPTTNHLSPDMNWYALFHDSPWHDFHMVQSGHARRSVNDIADLPLAYYKRVPVKALVNGEPWYEAHPAMDTGAYGPVHSSAQQRYAFWVSMLCGATMGHTYGGQGIWNWKRSGDSEAHFGGPQVGPVWSEGLQLEGAHHLSIGVKFLRTLSWWALEPCPERAQLDPSPADLAFRPFCATVPGKLWLAYLPAGVSNLILKGIEPLQWRGRWLDPRTGVLQTVGTVVVDSSRMWKSPLPPTPDDWVLMLQAD